VIADPVISATVPVIPVTEHVIPVTEPAEVVEVPSLDFTSGKEYNQPHSTASFAVREESHYGRKGIYINR